MGNSRTVGHARERMAQRGISQGSIELALRWGRHDKRPKNEAYIVGRKEVKAAAKDGVDLKSVEGLHVVVKGGRVLTCYRSTGGRLKVINSKGPRRHGMKRRKRRWRN